MSSISHFRKSANEKDVEDLLADTTQWDKVFYEHTEEIIFYKTLVTSDIFENKTPNLYEKLQEYYSQLNELQEEKIELQEALHNHKNDLAGMMECEDISCESFYHSQHYNLTKRIEKHISVFRSLKLNLIRFSTPLLKKLIEAAIISVLFAIWAQYNFNPIMNF
jgi:hypothetical protein